MASLQDLELAKKQMNQLQLDMEIAEVYSYSE